MEMRGLLDLTPKGLLRTGATIGSRFTVGSQFLKPQGIPQKGGALLGRDFLLEGKVPNTAEYIHALGQLTTIPGLGVDTGIKRSSAARGLFQTLARPVGNAVSPQGEQRPRGFLGAVGGAVPQSSPVVQ